MNRMMRVAAILTALLLATAGAQGATKITFITNAAMKTAFDAIAAGFNETYKGRIEVVVDYAASGQAVIERALLQTLAGNAPDVLYQTFTGDLLANGLIADLTPYIARDASWRDDFIPAMLDVFRYEGRLFGIPLGSYGTWGVVYNQDLIAEAGLAAPPDGWNWNQFKEYGRKLVRDATGDGTPDIWGLVGLPEVWHDGLLYQNASNVYDWENNVWLPDRDLALETLEYQLSLINESAFQAPFNLGWPGPFATGKAAMIFGQQEVFRLFTKSDLNLAATHLPVNRSRQMGIKSWGLYLGKTGDPVRMDAAWQFIKYALQPDTAYRITEVMSYISGRRSVLSSREYLPYLERSGLLAGLDFWMAEIEKYGKGYPFPPGRPAYWNLVNSLTSQAAELKVAPVELIEQVQRAANPTSAEIARQIKAEIDGQLGR